MLQLFNLVNQLLDRFFKIQELSVGIGGHSSPLDEG
jgi:hypothetical protein